MTLLLLACTGAGTPPETVTVAGYIATNPGVQDALAGATVSVRDHTFEEVDSAVTDDEGFFSVVTTAGVPVYFDLQAEGYVPTAFSGNAGLVDWELALGDLWIESEDDLAELEARYAGCPGVGEGGGIIAGEIRFWAEGYEPGDGEEWPMSTTGFGRAYATDGESWDSCHLDDSGEAYSADALVTGESGQYAIFGGPTGPVTLTLGYVIEEEPLWGAEYRIYVPDGGIAPLWPSYVPFPG